ncbi:hypothetical protein ACTOVP_05560 [Arcanobacterium canis]
MTQNNTHKFTKLGAAAAVVLTAMSTLGACSTPEASTPAQDASPHADASAKMTQPQQAPSAAPSAEATPDAQGDAAQGEKKADSETTTGQAGSADKTGANTSAPADHNTSAPAPSLPTLRKATSHGTNASASTKRGTVKGVYTTKSGKKMGYAIAPLYRSSLVKALANEAAAKRALDKAHMNVANRIQGVADARARLAKARVELDAAKVGLKAAMAARAELAPQLAKANDTLSVAKELVALKQKAYDAALSVLEGKETALANANAGVTMARKNLETAQKDFAAAQKKIADDIAAAEKKVAQAEANIETAKDNIASAYDGVSKAEEELDKARAGVVEASNNLQAVEAEVARDHKVEADKVQAAKVKLDQALEQVAPFQDAYNEAKEKYDELELSLKAQRQALAEAKADLAREIEQAKADLALAQGKVKTLTESKTQAEKDLATAKTKVESSTAAFTEAEKRVAQAKAELDAARRQAGDATKARENAINTAQAELSRVTAEHETLKQANDQAKRDLALKQAALTDARAAYDKAVTARDAALGANKIPVANLTPEQKARLTEAYIMRYWNEYRRHQHGFMSNEDPSKDTNTSHEVAMSQLALIDGQEFRKDAEDWADKVLKEFTTKRTISHDPDMITTMENVAARNDANMMHPKALAEALFSQWYHSAGHEKNMVVPDLIGGQIVIRIAPNGKDVVGVMRGYAKWALDKNKHGYQAYALSDPDAVIGKQTPVEVTENEGTHTYGKEFSKDEYYPKWLQVTSGGIREGLANQFKDPQLRDALTGKKSVDAGSLDQEVARTKDLLAQAESSLASVKDKAQAAQVRVDAAQREVERAKSALDEARNGQDPASKLIRQAEERLNAAIAQRDQAKSVVEETTKKIDTLTSQLAQAQANLAEFGDGEPSSLSVAFVEHYTESVKKLEAETPQALQEMKARKAELDKVQSSVNLDQAKKDLDAARKHLAEVTGGRTEAALKAMKEAEANVQAKEKALEAAKTAVQDAFKAQVDARENRVKAQTDLDTARKATVSDKTVTEAKANLDHKLTVQSEAVKAVKDAKAPVDTAKHDLDTARKGQATAQSEVDQLEQKAGVAKAKADVDTTTKNVDKAEKNVKKAESDLEAAKHAQDKAKGNLDDAHRGVTKAKAKDAATGRHRR